ncbi:MAG: phosphatidylserine decarboxylase [Candidatus Heimdallarchaeota archaeon]
MLAKGSEPIILTSLLFFATSMIFVPLSWFLLIPVAAFGILLGFSLFFFRDPERIAPEEEGVMVAPVDGRIVAIDELDNGNYRIQIQISIFNVHINRTPLSGTVINVQKQHGAFWPVWYKRKYEDKNARQHVDLKTDEGFEMRVTQISGIVAWRCVSYVSPGTHLERNQRFGLIRFGSAMRVEFPKSSGYKPVVKLNDKIRSGEMIIARKEQ